MTDFLFATAYMGPIQQYARLIRATHAWEEHCENYVKQTYRNRAVILGANGPVALTIPIEHSGDNHMPIGQVTMSRHNNWRHIHWQTLVSAYESSPFFQFYADDLHAVYFSDIERLVDFNAALSRLFLQWLFIDITLEPTAEYLPKTDGFIEDCRTLISPKNPLTLDPHFHPVPYSQTFGTQADFSPNLSVADLLFNMGPESRLILRACYE